MKGAPVLVSQEHVRDGRAQAIVASSGCSNVCTGEQGMKDAREMTRIVGELLHVPPKQVLIASTGVIGQALPMDKIRAGLPKLVKGLSPQGGRSAAEAILTTDTLREGSGAAHRGRRPAGDHRRHRQGRGDARAAPGDDVLLPRHRRDGGVRCARRGASPRRGRIVQPRHRRRRSVDERHGGGARQWPGRERHARARGQGTAPVRSRAFRR